MIIASEFAGKRVVVFGLGKSGLSTAQSLKSGGAIVLLSDDNAQNREQALLAGYDVLPPDQIVWDDYETLVLSPGVPLTHPEPHMVVERAQHSGLDIIGDVELFFLERQSLAPNECVICITGTNGKSTTTALTAHVLEQLGHKVAMGGNIGVPVLSLPMPGQGYTYVLELSSYQIDLTPSLHPSIGVLLNISEDHLDRHGDMANYANVKRQLVANSDFPIVVTDDFYTQDIAKFIQRTKGDNICSASEGFSANMEGHSVLKGAHNVQNAMAAFAVAWYLKHDAQDIMKAIYSFKGLEHRMEPCGTLDGVAFINDSKATNVDSAEKALMSFDDIFWIAGGKPKTGGIEALAPYFSKIAKAFLIGVAAEEFSKTLDKYTVPYEIVGTMDVAVEEAFKSAVSSNRNSPVVLLSPACASFDQYKSFEHRGEHFKELVAGLSS